MRVRLELNQLNIDRPKKRWNIYFVVVTEHPTEVEKMVLATIPTEAIKMVPSQNNEVTFDDGSPNSEGLLLLRRILPATKELNVHFYVRHSRSSDRTVGEVLKDIQTEIGDNAMGTISDIHGTNNPWLIIAKTALPVISKILTKLPDRDMGFISMFERFGKEFENEGNIDRQKTGAFSTVVYTWAIDED
ncbi:hypothetical protein [Flavobacterium sp.]|jgi:hypothetical protein|uniref:hypothetical protein n=1 Tax=Flavobacterium sp. TaxID=239 RepID=UPI0037BFA068